MAHFSRYSAASSDEEISSKLPRMPIPVIPPLSPASDVGRDRQQESAGRLPSGLAERGFSFAHQVSSQVQDLSYKTIDEISPGQHDHDVFFAEHEQAHALLRDRP